MGEIKVDRINYMLWYHKLFGKTVKGKKALKYYGSYENFYNAVFSNNEAFGITGGSIDKYKSFNLVDTQLIKELCANNNWEIIPWDSEYYPKDLLLTDDYPHILFCDGDKQVLKRNVKFAIVGSREANEKAEIIAYNSAYNLAKSGAVIVSGSAFGIDSAAHAGAIKANGKTIGVLGCGLGNPYMKRIGDFYSSVKKSGAYITELFPFEGVTRSSFPDRNRIISGISKAVFIACASEKSGSLNTAGHAKKQRRRIYVPAPEICYSSGCEKLLNQGAYVFYNAGDMAYPYKECYEEELFNENYCNKSVSPQLNYIEAEDMALPKKTKAKQNKETQSIKQITKYDNETITESKQAKKTVDIPEYLSEDAKAILSLNKMEFDTDELVSLTGKNIVQIQIALSELEAEMLIKALPGGRIKIL